MEAVTLVVIGGSPMQLAALEAGTIDATVLTYGGNDRSGLEGHDRLGRPRQARAGFPDRTIITRRSFLKRNGQCQTIYSGGQ